MRNYIECVLDNSKNYPDFMATLNKGHFENLQSFKHSYKTIEEGIGYNSLYLNDMPSKGW